MFRNPLVAVMHLVIYVGFVIINIEVLEIVLDGLLGTHCLLALPDCTLCHQLFLNGLHLA